MTIIGSLGATSAAGRRAPPVLWAMVVALVVLSLAASAFVYGMLGHLHVAEGLAKAFGADHPHFHY